MTTKQVYFTQLEQSGVFTDLYQLTVMQFWKYITTLLQQKSDNIPI